MTKMMDFEAKNGKEGMDFGNGVVLKENNGTYSICINGVEIEEHRINSAVFLCNALNSRLSGKVCIDNIEIKFNLSFGLNEEFEDE